MLALYRNSYTVSDLAELNEVVQSLMADCAATGHKPYTVLFNMPLVLAIKEERLTDNSTVLNMNVYHAE
jgi:hypothetical protein